LCRYTYADHRKCLTPRSPTHPHFCYFHARRESQSVCTDKLADDLAYFFSGQYISANDLCYALGRLIPAVVRGDIKPRTASTLAYLAQTFIQAIQVAQKEYTYAFGSPEWGTEIRNNISGNFDRLNESDTPAPEPQPAPDSDSPANPGSACEPEPSSSVAASHDPDSRDRSSGSSSGGSLDPCSCSGGNPEPDEQQEGEPADPDEGIETDESDLTLAEATLMKN
jgi:hypothetical protein